MEQRLILMCICVGHVIAQAVLSCGTTTTASSVPAALLIQVDAWGTAASGMEPGILLQQHRMTSKADENTCWKYLRQILL